MTEEKISIEKIAEKHNLDEEIVDSLFYYWDVNSWNDVEHTLNEIAKKLSSEQYIHFLIDVLKYIHQTEFDLFEKGEMRYVPDKDTCNPKICKWCKYSNNGKRDPTPSISMCDGCRYNEEFEHIQIKIRW